MDIYSLYARSYATSVPDVCVGLASGTSCNDAVKNFTEWTDIEESLSYDYLCAELLDGLASENDFIHILDEDVDYL